jgi:protease I
MARIGIIFSKRSEELEYRKPAEAFHRAGHELVHLGGPAKEKEKSPIQGSPRKIEKSIEEVSVQEFDALLIPGGYYPERLEFAEEELHFLMAFLETGKPIFGTGRISSSKGGEGRKGPMGPILPGKKGE